MSNNVLEEQPQQKKHHKKNTFVIWPHQYVCGWTGWFSEVSSHNQRNKEYGYGVRLRFLVTFRKSVARSEKKWKEGPSEEYGYGTVACGILEKMERSRSTVKEYGFPLFTSFENPDEVKRSDQKCQQYFLTVLPDLPNLMALMVFDDHGQFNAEYLGVKDC